MIDPAGLLLSKNRGQVEGRTLAGRGGPKPMDGDTAAAVFEPVTYAGQVRQEGALPEVPAGPVEQFGQPGAGLAAGRHDPGSAE